MSASAHQTRNATAVGLLAILLWSCLAFLTTRARGIPPFELLSLAFAVAFVLGLIVLAAGKRLKELKARPAAWLSSFAGLFLFHVLYFFALGWAPAGQANLIIYLWPLFIVILSSLGDIGNPRAFATCVVGGLCGFAGTALTLAGNGFAGISMAYWPGYLMAFGSACVWALYSVVNRRFGSTPGGMLVGVCGAVAVSGFALHSMVEHWVAPTLFQWMVILAIGAGPTGLAFFAWDYATKRGNLAHLGLMSYLAPLISTSLLIVAGEAARTPALLVAAVLIAGGALIPKMVEAMWPAKKQAPAE